MPAPSRHRQSDGEVDPQRPLRLHREPRAQRADAEGEREGVEVQACFSSRVKMTG